MASSSLILPLGSALAKSLSTNHQTIARCKIRDVIVRHSSTELSGKDLQTNKCWDKLTLIKRRDVLGLVLGVSSLLLDSYAKGAGLPPEEKPRLCDNACEKELENVPMVTTESGLQYKDIKVGEGPSPPIGFQVAANYVAMIPSGQIFDSSLEKGLPYIFRVGADQLAFPKGLTSAPGRPRVGPNSPVIFDVSLEYIPGLEADEE
ncbi:peptidyl-prolyl cis-trans isomerase FKBP16-3, chloroplastic isoform X2 [Cornus florida]|uniref:peptidyl-prolyl cis-trans isomerase FKBP16-3, chloroplastic isoform X2 n=1 Tax=Cornus florida TaxID=4283 RepID=UPI0028A2DE33|nr:peptidyl-prolyl cis-trans isomerase FKBP16-3, chloroplastic isoform X2 [Cornus florida]